MNLLLDTHTLIWMATDAARLSADATSALTDPANDLYASAVSGWEISIKRARGRLRFPDVDRRMLATLRVAELPVTFDHAAHVARLPELHRDPFDRMLIAQAVAEDLTIVSRDRAFEGYPVSVHW